ncbi:MAG: hypothetical protein OEZ34_03320 [Spirochaetia bacterium]|nr:hypothetical protein [Spirochaetia bacterium]
MIYFKTPFLISIISLIVFASGCRNNQITQKNPKLLKYPVPENNIIFYAPVNWQESKDHYFHFKIVGFAPNGLPASIEYRGLDFKTLDESGKNLYATGWYEAIAKNYPEWKYEYKKKSEDDPEGTYEFEGTYTVATDTYRRIGKLRFRKKQIHAIYYTAIDREFDPVRIFFNNIDERILYDTEED